MTYTMKEDFERGPVKAGDTVYDCKGHDYGLARDDTESTGVKHISVTLDPNGGYPFFTVPVRLLVGEGRRFMVLGTESKNLE